MERRIDRLEKYMIIKKLNDNQVTKDCDLSVGLLNQAKRGKTGVEFTFMLLKPALAVLKEYGDKLPLLSNVKYNEYLKVVAQTTGVDKPITTHWARHTGATMLLNAGVDMETVAKILGHSSTRITRSTYAKLLDDTVGREMEKAEEKE